MISRTFDKKIAKLGVIAGVVPSILNHVGEFMKWSIFAKTATEWGFWVIFVSLIIAISKTRKIAVVSVVVFCIIMMIAYGATEAIFSPSGLAYFLEYQRGQFYWYGVIVILVPISAMIWGSLQKNSYIIERILGVVLVVAPLLYTAYEVLAKINRQVIVCANIAKGWRSDICTLQSPDGWINGNYVATIVVYIGFIIWWLYFFVQRQRSKGEKSTPSMSTVEK